MADNKDFLNQFSNQGKPASFQEEERIPVTKERKPLNIKLLIGLLIAAIVLAIASYFIFFAPRIVVPDFVGKTKSDVAAWTKQQGIEQSGILFEERYDFDTDEGVIMSQSIQEGKKVKNNVKMNFLISLGADPDEKIAVPNISSMDKDELQEWIKKNKLAKTKLITAFNENVNENEVIDYSFSGCDEDSFTRGCSLRINISKGSAPAGKITVEDFEKKMYESVEAWAKTKKVKLVKVEQYSSTVDKGYVISQSVPSGKTMDEGGEFVVTVSLGKAVTMPNMYEWTENQIRSWCSKNGIILSNVDYRYDPEAKGECIDQSIKPNTLAKEGDLLDVVISLDDADIGEFIESIGGYENITSVTLNSIEAWVKEKNSKGGSLSIRVSSEMHDTVPINHVISMTRKTKNSDVIDVVISDGRNIMINMDWDAENDDESKARELCENSDPLNPLPCNFTYEKDETKCNGQVIRYERSDNKESPKKGTYINQRVVINVVITDNGVDGACKVDESNNKPENGQDQQSENDNNENNS